MKVPAWARWTARDPDGWRFYFSERPVYHGGYWFAPKGVRETQFTEKEYFDHQTEEPSWWWRRGPLPWFVWIIVSRFTLRRVR
jgi:hypothetical protein